MTACRMEPQPYSGVHDFKKFLDPFHDEAFVGTPAEGMGKKGKRETVWLALDKWGTEIGILEIPPGKEHMKPVYIDEVKAWFWSD